MIVSAGVSVGDFDLVPAVLRQNNVRLLFEKIDANGWPIDKRVGRHTSAVLQTMVSWTEMHPDKPMVCDSIPRYADVVARGLGQYLRNPALAKPGGIWYE